MDAAVYLCHRQCFARGRSKSGAKRVGL